MSLTITGARDEMAALVKTAWDAASSSAPLLYRDQHRKPPETGSWARLTIQHVTGGQGSLVGADTTTRWDRLGVLTIQIFHDAGAGMVDLDSLSQAMLNALEGATTAGGVWFRNARLNEIGPDGRWQQVNVLADFEYEQIK